jgi:hypothetical protein
MRRIGQLFGGAVEIVPYDQSTHLGEQRPDPLLPERHNPHRLKAHPPWQRHQLRVGLTGNRPLAQAVVGGGA